MSLDRAIGYSLADGDLTETRPGVVCPDWSPDPDDDLLGCGRSFTAYIDWEGWTDCPHCGLMFDVTNPANTVAS